METIENQEIENQDINDIVGMMNNVILTDTTLHKNNQIENIVNAMTDMISDMTLDENYEKYTDTSFSKLNFENCYLPSTIFTSVCFDDCNFGMSKSGEIIANNCSLFKINYNFITIPKITFTSSYLQDCSFDGFDGTIIINSSVIEGGMIDGQYAKTNFNSSVFNIFTFGRLLYNLTLTNCEFTDCDFNFSYLESPLFINCKFKDCSFDSISCEDGYFDMCVFIECVFNNSIWINSIFSNCYFDTCEDLVPIMRSKLIGTKSSNGILELT